MICPLGQQPQNKNGPHFCPRIASAVRSQKSLPCLQSLASSRSRTSARTEIWVAKLSKSASKEANSLEAYKQQMEVNTVCSFLATEYNKCLDSLSTGLELARLYIPQVYTFQSSETSHSCSSTAFKVRDQAPVPCYTAQKEPIMPRWWTLNIIYTVSPQSSHRHEACSSANSVLLH